MAAVGFDVIIILETEEPAATGFIVKAPIPVEVELICRMGAVPPI